MLNQITVKRLNEILANPNWSHEHDYDFYESYFIENDTKEKCSGFSNIGSFFDGFYINYTEEWTYIAGDQSSLEVEVPERCFEISFNGVDVEIIGSNGEVIDCNNREIKWPVQFNSISYKKLREKWIPNLCLD